MCNHFANWFGQFEILRQLSSHADNTIVGLVRDKAGTEAKVEKELKALGKVHILATDLSDYDSLKVASLLILCCSKMQPLTDSTSVPLPRPLLSQVALSITSLPTQHMYHNGMPLTLSQRCAQRLTSRNLSNQSANTSSANDPIGLSHEMDKLVSTNVTGNIYLYNLFMPLILAGGTKKVICISSGMADTKLCNDYELTGGSLYAISKAAMNMVTAKFNAQYKSQGVLFMGICPGMVDVGAIDPATRKTYRWAPGAWRARLTCHSDRPSDGGCRRTDSEVLTTCSGLEGSCAAE